MIILFDGVCNLCNSVVQFIIKRDEQKVFKFASLQSDFASQLFEGKAPKSDSVMLVTEQGIFDKSTAVIKIAKHLKGFKFLAIFSFIPLLIRDFIYDLIARNRYKLFGKQNECMIPSPELRERFLV